MASAPDLSVAAEPDARRAGEHRCRGDGDARCPPPLHHPRPRPVRGDRVGDARRVHPRQGQARLRAEGRRVPQVLVADGDQHRRAEVLPRPADAPRARAQRQADDRPRRRRRSAAGAATGGYFATDEEAETFEAELKAILVNQLAAFNSPVWFNVGFEEKPQCSACQPYHALVSTPEGMVPIGELVEDEQIGREVYDANGVTRVVAVKANGVKPVYRVTLRNGQLRRGDGRPRRQGGVTSGGRQPAVAARRSARARDAHAPAPASREGRRSLLSSPSVPGRCRERDEFAEADASRRVRRGRARRLAPGGRLRRPVRPRHEPLADDRVPGRERRRVRLGDREPRRRSSRRAPARPRRRDAGRVAARAAASGSTARSCATSSSAGSSCARGTDDACSGAALDRLARRDRRLPAEHLPGRRLRHRPARAWLREWPGRVRRDRRALGRGRPAAAQRASASTPAASASTSGATDRHDLHEVADLRSAPSARASPSSSASSAARSSEAARVARPARAEALP